MKLRTQPGTVKLNSITPAERFLHRLQSLRGTRTGPMPLEQIEQLEKEFVELCYDLEPITRGDKSILLRSLRMYGQHYQKLKGEEKHPAHKQDLQNYIDAADKLYARLFGVPMPTKET